ncbi:hypothetical protein XENORESO_019384 [Xenotaenia resolanae]|uniref:Uncharacterized protein n=1 Tax=Xenotaenia resolanae TaxID=208358 RepID=A0ABV0W437_9TELE
MTFMRATTLANTIAILRIYVVSMWVSFWLPAPGISIKIPSMPVSPSPNLQLGVCHGVSPFSVSLEVPGRVNSNVKANTAALLGLLGDVSYLPHIITASIVSSV